jgi:hypothetical protein
MPARWPLAFGKAITSEVTALGSLELASNGTELHDVRTYSGRSKRQVGLANRLLLLYKTRALASGSEMDVTRRRFAAVAGTLATGVIAAPIKSVGIAAESFADSEAAASWMAEAIANSERAPSGVLRLSRFVEAIWFLTAPIGWRPNPGQEKLFAPIEVPTGFVTDLASIPRIFWTVLPRDGEYAYAAIIHDYLYWTHISDRSTSDEILRSTMVDFGVPSWQLAAIYGAVRLGGGGPWDENRRLYEQGERRVLKTFPDDPAIRWTDWKKRSDVFAPEPKHGTQ